MDLLEYTLKAARQKQRFVGRLHPKHWSRVATVRSRGGCRLVSFNEGIMRFTVVSGTKDGVTYTVNLRFRNPRTTLKQILKGWKRKKVGTDLELAEKFRENVNFELVCSCPSSLYHGFDFIRTRKNAQYGAKEHRPPNIRNPHQYGFCCFDERALVLMADFSWRPINLVQVGEWVISHTGKPCQVVEASSRMSDDVYDMRTSAFPDYFGVTGEHPFYVQTKKYHQRTLGEKGTRTPHWTTSNDWVEARNLKKSRNSLLFCPVFTGDRVEFDSEIAWFLGVFLAEGSYSVGSNRYSSEFDRRVAGLGSKGQSQKQSREAVTVVNRDGSVTTCASVTTTHNQNEDLLMTEMERIAAKMGVPTRREYKESNGKRWAVVSYYSKDLVRLVYRVCGRYSEHKRISAEVFQWDTEAVKAFLIGYCLGDGSVYTRGRAAGDVHYNSCNKEMLRQVWVLHNMIGCRPSMITRKPIRPGWMPISRVVLTNWDFPELFKAWAHYKELDLVFNASPNHRPTACVGGCGYVLSSFVKTSDRVVYNIGVADDSSYIVNGVAVHNCKHGTVVFDELPEYDDDISLWLNDLVPPTPVPPKQEVTPTPMAPKPQPPAPAEKEVPMEGPAEEPVEEPVEAPVEAPIEEPEMAPTPPPKQTVTPTPMAPLPPPKQAVTPTPMSEPPAPEEEEVPPGAPIPPPKQKVTPTPMAQVPRKIKSGPPA